MDISSQEHEMNMTDAQRQYPDAWRELERQMDRLRADHEAEIVPLHVEIGTRKDGTRVLEVSCVTDLIPFGSGQEFGGMRFQAPLDGIPDPDGTLH